MDLNDITRFRQLDPQDMLGEIDGLPEQLEHAWQSGQTQPAPDGQGIRQVIISGMGGSAIGADLMAAAVADTCRVPVFVHRDYALPAWAQGADTLVIASSHSGNTEETLSTFEAATQAGCRRLAVCTGGKLARAAQESGATLWQFEHHGQPRAAVGYSFGLLLAAFARMNLIPDPAGEVQATAAALKKQRESLNAQSPVVKNPAKRMAGQLVNRWVGVLAAGNLAPVARRWKGQISEIAKTWAQFEFLPEANHNSMAGILNPEAKLNEMMVVFLTASTDHPRNQLRSELTRKTFMLQGIGTDTIQANSPSALANQWTLLHYGDYVAYYLAMAYCVDPTPVEAIEGFKREMAAASQ